MNAARYDLDTIEAPDLADTLCSGRATWDERGNSIWEWQTAPGVYSRDISSQRLQELQTCALEVVDYQEDHTDWTQHNRSTQRDSNELVMPLRSRQPVSGAFDAFLKRLGV